MNEQKEKFTPGPWYCTDMGQIGKKGEKRLFCLASFHWEGVGEKEMMANAKLATAAPEMYEMLEGVLRYMQVSPLSRNPIIEGQIADLLARARGEAAK